MLKRFIIFFSFLLILTACKKDKQGEFSINGVVIDNSTGKGLSGVEITFWASKIISGVYNSNFEKIVSIKTDADGKFSTDIKMEKVSAYKIIVYKNNYFNYEEDISSDSFVDDGSYIFNYSISPIGYIKLRAVNNLPYDSSDFISYRFSSNYLNCFNCCNNIANKGYGQFFDSTFVCKAEGGSQLIVTWNVIKNNQSSYNNANIYCPAFDTTYFEISY